MQRFRRCTDCLLDLCSLLGRLYLCFLCWLLGRSPVLEADAGIDEAELFDPQDPDFWDSCAGYFGNPKASSDPLIVMMEASEHGKRNDTSAGTGASRGGRNRDTLPEPVLAT